MKNFKNITMIFLAALCGLKPDLKASELPNEVSYNLLDVLNYKNFDAAVLSFLGIENQEIEEKDHFSRLGGDNVNCIAEFLNIKEMRQLFSTSKLVHQMLLENPDFNIDRRWKIEHIRQKLPILSQLSTTLKERFSNYLFKNFILKEHPEFLRTFLEQNVSAPEMDSFKDWIRSDFHIYQSLYEKMIERGNLLNFGTIFPMDPMESPQALANLRGTLGVPDWKASFRWEYNLRDLYKTEKADQIQPNDLSLALRYAIRANNFSFMNFLISKKVSINHYKSSDKTLSPLIISVQEKNLTAAMILLDKGALFDKDDTDLMKSIIKYGNIEILKFFIDKGLLLRDQVFPDSLGSHHESAKNMMKFLLKKGMSLNNVWSSMNHSAKMFPDTAVFLIDMHHNHKNVLLQYAINTSDVNIDLIHFLVSKYRDFTTKKFHQNLISDLSFKTDHTLKVLINKNLINIELKDFSEALREKTNPDYLKLMLETMIKSNIDINGFYDKKTLLQRALEGNHHEFAHTLIEKGITVPDNGELIFQAIKNNDLETTKFLIQYKDQPNVTKLTYIHVNSKQEYFPIHYACVHDKLDIIKLLIEENTIFVERTPHGQSILHIATYWGHLEIIKFLLTTNKNLSWKDNDGFTPSDLIRKKIDYNEEHRIFNEKQGFMPSVLKTEELYKNIANLLFEDEIKRFMKAKLFSSIQE